MLLQDKHNTYKILWEHYNYLFDPAQNYWWTQEPNYVLNIISDMWKVADYKIRY